MYENNIRRTIMATIYSYQKKSDAYTTYQAQGTEENPITELCTLDDITYISAAGDLPAQPEQITVVPVELSAELRATIKSTSPHCQLIHQRMDDQIRAKYSLSEEQYFARIGVGVALGVYIFEPGEEAELLAFGDFVENVRQWGRDQRAGLGL
jgi:hypothetical protein